MKRNSILYDYKPRLEWSESHSSKKYAKSKKILILAGALIIGGGLYVGFQEFISKDSSSETLATSNSNSQTSKVTQTLELSPLTSKKTTTDRLSKTPQLTRLQASIVTDTDRTESIQVAPSIKPKLKTPEQVPAETTKLEMDKGYKPSAELTKTLSTKEKWRTVTVKDGDNLSLIFSRLAISKNDLYQILSLGDDTQSLKQLKPGQVLRLKFENSHIEELVHESDLTHTLKVIKSDDEFKAKVIEELPEIKVATSSGTIQDSLFLSGQKAGLSDNVIMQMFGIFGWDIDFVLDIRKDDAFHVVYEELYKNGEKIKDGKILAVEFVNQGKAFKAVRYIDSEEQPGYYTEQGKSMKKAFLRTPVNFTRISSHFNLSRKHPVLNKIRAHKGVDYAAPLGTPIKSTGNGKVIFVGVQNGYGNTVIIKHGGKYTTLYAHLSRFSRGLKKGKRVEQGQTIAYVGKSGLATGPHLHYEFRVNGAHRNPLTVDLPKSLPLPEKYMPDFRQKTKSLLTQLASLSDTTRHAQAKPEKEAVKKVIDVASREYPLNSTIN